MKPFNLEKALAGEPVILKNGLKAFIKMDLANEAEKIGKSFAGMLDIYGYYIHNNLIHPCSWFSTSLKCNSCSSRYDDSLTIIGMWEEPKRPTVTLTLPCPLKSLDNVDKAYSAFLEAEKSGDTKLIIYEFPKENFHEKRIQEQLAFGNLFASQEEAEAWEYAKQNNRR